MSTIDTRARDTRDTLATIARVLMEDKRLYPSECFPIFREFCREHVAELSRDYWTVWRAWREAFIRVANS